MELQHRSMGRSAYHLIKSAILAAMILCSFEIQAATVGLLVDKSSKQAVMFHQKLSELSPQHDVQLIELLQISKHLQTSADMTWVAMGPKALEGLLKQPFKGKALALFVSPSQAEQLRKSHAQQSFSWLNNTPSLKRQLALVKALKPQAKRIVLFHAQQNNVDLSQYEKTTKKLGFELSLNVLKDPLNWDRNALKALKSADLVLGLPDRAVYNATTIRSILMRLYRAGKPLVGPDKGYVRAGAVASTYASMTDTLQACATLLKDPTTWTPHIENMHFSVAVNAQVARSLNLSVSESSKLESQVRELMK